MENGEFHLCKQKPPVTVVTLRIEMDVLFNKFIRREEGPLKHFGGFALQGFSVSLTQMIQCLTNTFVFKL